MDDFKLTEFTDSFFSQTYSFDAQQVCYAPNHRIDGVKLEDACKIDWNPNGTVRAYGPIERGQFEGNPDIAGLGLFVYFAVGPIMSLFGIAFMFWEFSRRQLVRTILPRFNNSSRQGQRRGKVLQLLEGFTQPPATRGTFVTICVQSLHALLKASSDALTVITLSYVINFGISGKCTLSGYHYIFGINTMIISFASITLCVTLVRDYWAAPIAAGLRTAAHVVIFSLIGRLLAYEWTGEMLPEPLYIRNKAENNTDSSLFLPVACFLDHDLNPLDKLTQAQLKRVGWGEPKLLLELYAFCFLAVCFVAAHFAHLVRAKHRYSSGATAETSKEMAGGQRFAKWAKWYWRVIVFGCALINGFCYYHIWSLRQWVYGSGWMERLPGSDKSDEEDWMGIGQLGYFCTLFWVLLLFLDELRVCCCCCFQGKGSKNKSLRGKGIRGKSPWRKH